MGEAMILLIIKALRNSLNYEAALLKILNDPYTNSYARTTAKETLDKGYKL